MFLPWRPMWGRLLVNAAVLGGAWYLVVNSPRAVRRVRRALRGGCAGCGYELEGVAGNVCPECGASIPESFRRESGVVVHDPGAWARRYRSRGLTASLCAAGVIVVVWLASAFFYADVRVGPRVWLGVGGGDLRVLYDYSVPGAGWVNVRMNPRVTSLDWTGGSERDPDLLTVCVPLWMAAVLAMAVSSALARRARRAGEGAGLASRGHQASAPELSSR